MEMCWVRFIVIMQGDFKITKALLVKTKKLSGCMTLFLKAKAGIREEPETAFKRLVYHPCADNGKYFYISRR